MSAFRSFSNVLINREQATEPKKFRPATREFFSVSTGNNGALTAPFTFALLHVLNNRVTKL